MGMARRPIIPARPGRKLLSLQQYADAAERDGAVDADRAWRRVGQHADQPHSQSRAGFGLEAGRKAAAAVLHGDSEAEAGLREAEIAARAARLGVWDPESLRVAADEIERKAQETQRQREQAVARRRIERRVAAARRMEAAIIAEQEFQRMESMLARMIMAEQGLLVQAPPPRHSHDEDSK